MLTIKEQQNTETLSELSKKVATKIEESQMQIYEININQKTHRLRVLEIQAVLDGLIDWFIRQGFSDIEIYHLTKDIDLEKELFVN